MAINIGPKIGIDGEKAFRDEIQKIGQQLKVLDSEMELVTARFAENSNSQDALQAQFNILSKQTEAQKKGLAQLEAGLQSAAEKYGESSTEALKWQRSLNKANVDLLNMEKQLDNTRRALITTDDETNELLKNFKDLNSLERFDQELKTLDSQMKLVTASFASNGKSQEALAAKADILNKKIETQRNRLESMMYGLGAANIEYGKNSTESLKWQQSINEAIVELDQMTNELEATEAEMNGAADATGDMEKATVDAGDAAEETGSRFGGLGTALKTVAGLAAATAASVAAATGKLVKDVVSSFSELEQNTGGAEAVFGEYASAIQKTGEEAYKNLGVSQSEYLATANKMGALFQGSGIEQQASLELTEQAMQRAADMASVMGIETSAALEAVAGAAKGNFEMMDNLGVAMNATSIEAYAVGKGLDFVWNEASQADKVQVAMQMFFEKTEQYAGNFARESEKTISGSMGMLKASVKSLTAGLGNAGADMTNLAGNVVTSFLAMVNNITPVIRNIVSAVPAVIQQIASGLVSAAPALLATVSEVFTSVLTTLNESLPQLLPVIMSALTMVANTLIENLPLLMDTSLQILLGLIDSVSENFPALIPMVVQAVLTIAQGLIDNIDQIIAAGFDLLKGLAKGLIDALPVLIDAAPDLIAGIIDGMISALPEIVASAGEIIGSLIQGILKALPKLLQNAPKIITTIIDGIKGFLFKIGDIGKNIIEGLWEGIKSMGDWLWVKISGFFGSVWDGICDFFGISSPSKEMAWVGEMLNRGLAEGIQDTEALSIHAAEQMGKAVTDAVSGIRGDITVGAQLSDNLRPVYDAVTMQTPTTEAVAYNAAAGMVNGMQAAIQNATAPVKLEIPIVIDGMEFSRAIIPDLREVMRANPEVDIRI